jgi:hypothetical protein
VKKKRKREREREFPLLSFCSPSTAETNQNENTWNFFTNETFPAFKTLGRDSFSEECSFFNKKLFQKENFSAYK